MRIGSNMVSAGQGVTDLTVVSRASCQDRPGGQKDPSELVTGPQAAGRRGWYARQREQQVQKLRGETGPQGTRTGRS